MAQQVTESKLPHYTKSYWLDSAGIPSYPKLAGNIQVDVAIVGGGITGITTAYLLAKAGRKVAVLEAGRLLNGTTGHTTAKITAQHDLIYAEFLSHFGQKQTRLYYEANMEALQFIKQIVQEHQLDCQFSEEDACIYTTSEQYVQKLSDEYQAYETLGIPGSYQTETPLPFPTKAAIVMPKQAQFNPIPFLTHLVGEIVNLGGQFYEQTTVESVDTGVHATLTTNEGHHVYCQQVVSASHFPFHDMKGLYFARLYAECSYALAMKPKQPFSGGMYLSAENPKRSLRSVLINGEPMVIVGGESHKTGQGIDTFQYYEALEAFAEETYGVEKILYRWSAQDLYTLDKLPYIGRQQAHDPHLYIATGYKKWGMTTSVVAAILNSKLILGESSPYEELFSPSRFHADPDVKTFITTNADVAAHLIAGKLEMPQRKAEELEKDEGAVVRVNGKRAGAYRDTSGMLHIVDTTCTHMGCELDWNEAEKTWDCPCHGSRFTYQGDVVEGPAKKALARLKG